MNLKSLSFFLYMISIYFQSIICLHFDFSQSPVRCYLEEFLHDSHVGINYKIWTKDSKKPLDYVNTHIVPRIDIKIVSDDQQLIYSEKLKSSNNKFSYINKKQGFYFVCAEYSTGWSPDGEILMSLNFVSVNQEEPNIMNAVKFSDLDPIKMQLEEIINKGKQVIKSQEEELQMEDFNAKRQMVIIHYFYKLTVYQVIAFILLGVYQAYSFRKILNK